MTRGRGKGEDKSSMQYSLFFIQRFKGKVLFNVPMSDHTSFRIGGPADVMAFPQDEGDLKDLMAFAESKGFQFHVLGAGTNLLVRDGGVRGIVVNMSEGFKDISWLEGGKAVVGAGVRLTELVTDCRDKGLSGLEFAVNIPGTIGGAVIMNAGAYGSEMKDVVEGVEILGRKGQKGFIPRSELNFSYRKSELPKGAIVTRAHMRFEKRDVEYVKERIKELREKRKAATGGIHFPNAGLGLQEPRGQGSGHAHRRGGPEGRALRRRRGLKRARQFYSECRRGKGKGRARPHGPHKGPGLQPQGSRA